MLQWLRDALGIRPDFIARKLSVGVGCFVVMLLLLGLLLWEGVPGG